MIRKLILLTLLLGAFWGYVEPDGVEGNAPLEGDFPAAEFVEKVHQIGGQARSIFQNDETLIVGRTGLTTLYDVGDMVNPVEIGAISNFTAQAISGDYLYGTMEGSNEEWTVWNIGQPTNPLQVGTFQPAGRFLASSDDYLIFENSSNTAIVIYSLASPATPERGGTWGIQNETTYIAWVEIIESQVIVALYIVGCGPGYCYNEYRSPRVLDISNPYTPISIGEGETAVSERPIHSIRGRYLYQAYSTAEGGMLYVSELTKAPVQIIPRYTLDLGEFIPKDISISEATLYVATMQETKIFDIHNPALPEERGVVPLTVAGPVYGSYLFGLSRHSDTLYDSLNIPYITIFDLTDPIIPSLISTIFHAAGEIAIQSNDNTLYLLDGSDVSYYYPSFVPYSMILHTVDTQLPHQPRLVRTDVIGEFSEGYPFQMNMQVIENEYLYLTREGFGIEIYKLATYSTPFTYIRTVTIPNLGRTAIADTTLVVSHTDSGGGVDFYDITNPETPVFTVHAPFQHNMGVKILTEGNHVYLAGDPSTYGKNLPIYILDVSESSVPVFVGSFDTRFYPTQSHAWTVADGYLYYYHDEYPTADYLAVADVRNPSHPEVALFPTLTIPFPDAQLQSDELRLYVAKLHCEFDIHLYRLNPPVTPHFTGATDKPGDCTVSQKPLIPQGDYFYVVDDYQGVRAFSIREGITHFLPLLQRNP